MTGSATDELVQRLGGVLRPGDGIVWGQGPAQPRLLSQALLRAAHTIDGLRVFSGIGQVALEEDTLRDVALRSYCGAGHNRRWHQAGLLDIVPTSYADIPALMQGGQLPCDVVALLLPPPDASGHCSLGLAADYLVAALRHARVVLAEVNPNVPWTCGPHRIHVDDIRVRIASDHDVATTSATSASPAEDRLAAHVCDLVEDGATLQLGIGQLPEKIALGLANKAELGVHSGVYGDALMRLAQRGVVTNARKGIDEGTSITGLVMGSAALNRHVDRNPAVQLRETGYTHAIAVMSALNRFTSINSALEVDLTGQVNAEVIAGRYVGAVGGMADFARGSRASPGGCSVIALTSMNGDRSRIVSRLDGPTTLARSDVDHIVTEYGVAHLRGASLRSRARQMIGIAHPDHRESLAREAHAMGLGGRGD